MALHRKASRDQPTDPHVSAGDRRAVCRYSVFQDQAWLGWWDGQTFVKTPGRILDISLRGAMLNVEQLPPEEQPVWFCASGAAPAEWLEARTVQGRKQFLGPRIVRLAFQKIFPYESFKVLVYGPDALGGMTPVQQQEW